MIQYKSGCFSLKTFNLLDDIFVVDIPVWRCIFSNRSNIGLATLKFKISVTCSTISLQKLLFEIGTTTNNFTCGSHDSLLLMITLRRFSCLTFFCLVNDFSCLIIFFLIAVVSFLHFSLLNSMSQFF